LVQSVHQVQLVLQVPPVLEVRLVKLVNQVHVVTPVQLVHQVHQAQPRLFHSLPQATTRDHSPMLPSTT
jgi:hypothetical protein